jgi:response regulator NasT
MGPSLRIIVADDESSMVHYFQETLELLGHQVVAGVQTGRELVQQCRALKPDLVITDIKMPDMDGLHAAAEISRDQAVPIIVVSAYHDPELIERAEKNHVLAFLVKPIKQSDLGPTIAIALRKFNEFQAMRKESAELRQALEERKIIERAKGILMKNAALDPAQAFQRIEELALAKGHKTAEIAEMIVVADNVFHGSTKSQNGSPTVSSSSKKSSRNGN